RPLDGERDQVADRRIPLVEERRELLGVAVDAERELGQVVRSDRKAVEDLGEVRGADHVARDLAHDVELEPVLTANGVRGAQAPRPPACPPPPSGRMAPSASRW